VLKPPLPPVFEHEVLDVHDHAVSLTYELLLVMAVPFLQVLARRSFKQDRARMTYKIF
jgi:hypothetical protein